MRATEQYLCSTKWSEEKLSSLRRLLMHANDSLFSMTVANQRVVSEMGRKASISTRIFVLCSCREYSAGRRKRRVLVCVASQRRRGECTTSSASYRDNMR